MESNHKQPRRQTIPASYNEPREKSRILMQYAGIFPNNIKEYAEKIVPAQKRQRNYAR